jgi:hypothetical protein
MNDDESDAMWKIYVKDGAGIAIQSTVDRLKRCFDSTDRPVHIGVVQYIDYDQTPPPVGFPGNSWFLFKRRAFRHERELRVGVWSEDVEIQYLKNDGSIGSPEDHDRQKLTLRNPKKPGVYVPVDLNVLIDKIVIAPQSPSWFAELVSSITNRLGYSFTVEASQLRRMPPLSLLNEVE